MADLFDCRARTIRRERAFRSGPALFLYERAFEDILDRLRGIRRSFESALLIGTPDPSWPDRLSQIARCIEAADPGAGFARAGGAMQAEGDFLRLPAGTFDLCVVVGMLDTVNDLPGALLRLRSMMRPDSLLIGVVPGGDTLPQLRASLRAADAVTGEAFPRVHPRIEAAALGQLLAAAGFMTPVVDIDRIKASYLSLRDLVRDLRGMGVTNVLAQRSRRPLTRKAIAAAEEQFSRFRQEGRTVETFELLHFAAWTPAADSSLRVSGR